MGGKYQNHPPEVIAFVMECKGELRPDDVAAMTGVSVSSVHRLWRSMDRLPRRNISKQELDRRDRLIESSPLAQALRSGTLPKPHQY